MNKKAEHELLFVAFEILILGILFGILFARVNSLSKDTFIQKEFYKRDLAFTFNSLLSSPGNIHYRYPETLNFDLSFDNNKIVFSELETSPFYFIFSKDTFFSYNNKNLFSPVNLEIMNSGYSFSSDSVIDPKLLFFKYPFVSTNDSLWKDKNIVFQSDINKDPKTGYEYKEKESFVSPVIERINQLSNKETAKLNSPNPDLLILVSSVPGDNIIINIPNNPFFISKNRKLASLFANKIIDYNPIIIPVKGTAPFVAMDIELGEDFLKKESALVLSSLYDSIKDYYGVENA